MGIKLSSVATLTAHNTKASEVGEGWHSSALFNQVMFAVLHVLLNNLALLNPVQSYHPCSCEYTDMEPFVMHCFQWCGGSLKSVSKILGVICSPLLHWSSQFYMWCSIAQHCWTLTTSPHPHSREYTDVQPFSMRRFWGGRASLNWFIIIFGVSCPSLLRWCSQCYMCCSIAPHVNTQSIPKKFMHQFWEWAVHRC